MPEEFKEIELPTQKVVEADDEEDYDELDQTTIVTDSIEIDYEEGQESKIQFAE